MRNPEFIELRNRFFKAIVITLIFVVPLIFFMVNRFSSKSLLLKNVQEGKDLVIFLIDDKCKDCKSFEKILKQEEVNYFELNKDENVDFKEIMLRIEMESKYGVAPGIILVEEGKMTANIMDLKNQKELELFLEKHNLVNKG